MVYRFTSGIFFFFNLVLRRTHTQKGREPQLRFLLVLEKYVLFQKRSVWSRTMLPQLTQLPSQRSARQRVRTAIPDPLGKENLGKCWRITPDSSRALTEPSCWRTRVSMRLGKAQKVLLGARVSPLSHALPVGTKGLTWHAKVMSNCHRGEIH